MVFPLFCLYMVSGTLFLWRQNQLEDIFNVRPLDPKKKLYIHGDLKSLLSSPITLCSESHDLNKAKTLWAWGVDAALWSPQSEWHLSAVTFHTSISVPDGACLYMPGIWWTSDKLLLKAWLVSYILNVYYKLLFLALVSKFFESRDWVLSLHWVPKELCVFKFLSQCLLNWNEWCINWRRYFSVVCYISLI